jgi:hypothetical protein
MHDPHEVIITSKDSSKPRVAQFSELFALRNDITSMMYLWNTSCYYVDVVRQTFIINGGRKIVFGDFKACKILYRRRNQISYALNSDNNDPKKKLNWLLGLEEIGTKRKVLLIISEDGCFWEWANKL